MAAPEWKTADRQLDVRGEQCPIPALKAKVELASMAAGDLLEIVATDPLAEMDLAILCDRLGHQLVASEVTDGELRVQIQCA